MEFRFAHCAERSRLGDVRAVNACIQQSFADPKVNARIASTSVSCWSEDQFERYALWELYGRRGEAIAIRVERSALERHILDVTDCPGVFGSVRYGFGGIERPSATKPEALCPFHGLSWEDLDDYRLFFHKHEFYRFEDEYRIILCSGTAMSIQIPKEIIESVIVSPFSSDSDEMMDIVRDFYGDRVQRSKLPRPY